MSQTLFDRPANTGARPSRQQIARALEDVLDPEIGLDVVALGLIYGIEIVEDTALIEMGVTTPACPFSRRLVHDVEVAAGSVPGVDHVDVTLSYDPAWSPAMLSVEAKGLLGWR